MRRIHDSYEKCPSGEFYRTMDDRIGFRGPASNAFRLLYDDLASPCPQCARFREKLYREKMEEVFRCCDGIDVYSPEALADKMIRYLTE